MYCLGVGGGKFHDASACIFREDELLFYIEEERLSRIRHSIDKNPFLSIMACLDFAGITLKDVNLITLSWNPYHPKDTSELFPNDPVVLEIFPENIFGPLKARIKVVDHQLSHASSAFRTSGYNKAIVISVDGTGDGKSLAVYRGENNRLIPLLEYDTTQSLGLFYETVTSFLGLGDWQNCGKTMALSSFGEPCLKFDFFSVDKEGFIFDYDGITNNKGNKSTSEAIDLFYREHKSIIYNKLHAMGLSDFNYLRFDRLTGNHIYREPTQEMFNIAASAQELIESALISIVKKYTINENIDNVCIAGGVALNCKANGKLGKEVKNIKNIYVPPFAADMGGAIGSALEILASLNVHKNTLPLGHAFWGFEFEDEEIAKLLKHLAISSQYLDDPTDCAAELICNGKILAWYQGRMEVGPRALGNRSILAKPDEKSIADYINREIKNREIWRPFSPSAIRTSIKQNWQLPQFASAYMTVALQGKEELKFFPGVMHVDNTSRVQVVNQAYSPRYYSLIEKIGQITGNAMVLNTSLNLRNMPIVCRPVEALQVFFSTPIDALIIGRNYLVKQ